MLKAPLQFRQPEYETGALKYEFSQMDSYDNLLLICTYYIINYLISNAINARKQYKYF